MPSHPSKLLAEKLSSMIQILETEELKLTIYQRLIEDYIVDLDILTGNAEHNETWREKIDKSKECEKRLRKISYELSTRIDRDSDLVEELEEAIELLDDL